MGQLDGRVAVVTGAAGSFGRVTAKLLHAEGAKVAMWDVKEEPLVAAARAISTVDGELLPLAVDIGDSAAVDDAAAQTRAALGPIEILVNIAGVVNAAAPWDVTDEDWDHHFRVNSSGTFWCIRACLPDMREGRYGKIVNIGSLAAQQGRPTTNPAYAASKGAVLGLTVSLARNLGEFGICVNAINPGFIRTDIHDQFDDDAIAGLAADIPLHRHGKQGEHGLPDDIAAAVLYLVSPGSDFVTGEYLSVNGGSRTGS